MPTRARRVIKSGIQFGTQKGLGRSVNEWMDTLCSSGAVDTVRIFLSNFVSVVKVGPEASLLVSI